MKFDITTPPTKELVLAAREAAGLTQLEAAQLIHRNDRRRWADFESGARQMQLDAWELFVLKARLPIQKEKHA